MSASSSADANICYVEQTIDADSDTHFSQNEFMDGIDDSVEPIEATSTPCHISVCGENGEISNAQVIYLSNQEMAEDFFGRKRIKKKPSSQLWSIPDRQPIYFTVEDNELVTSKRKSRIPKKKSLALANNGVSEDVSNSTVTKSWFTSKKDKTDLAESGMKWKTGQWLREEVQILEDNIQKYCNQHSIMDVRTVIFENPKEKRKDFYRFIADGLHRPLFSVYRRVTRMYDKKNYMGKYSPQEVQQLAELKEIHKNDWVTIGHIMGRSAGSVKDRCRLMRKCVNAGKWLNEEEERLTQAVNSLSMSNADTQGVSWSAVSKQVATRSEKQCRTKWLNYLNWKQVGGRDWKREDDAILLDKILEYPNENDINWEKLCENWSCARSPQWLRSKWWNFKRLVPTIANITNFRDMKSKLIDVPYSDTPSQSKYLTNPYRDSKLLTDISSDLKIFKDAGDSSFVITATGSSGQLTTEISEDEIGNEIISIIQPDNSNCKPDEFSESNGYYSLVQSFGDDSSQEASQDTHLIFQSDNIGQLSLVDEEFERDSYNDGPIIIQPMPILNQDGHEIVLQSTTHLMDGRVNVYGLQTDEVVSDESTNNLCIINVNGDIQESDPLVMPTLIGESQLIDDTNLTLVSE